MLDSAAKVKKKYYPQKFLEEPKYEPKEIKSKNLIDDNFEKRLSDESGGELDNDETKSDNEKYNDESNE